jgi:nicotinamide-nucleotide amidase
VLRLFGVGESSVAGALAEAGGDGGGVEATICARDFEIHIDLLAEPGAEKRADELAKRLRGSLERYVFAEDEQTVEEIVLGLCRTRGLSLATAESCTGGLVAARLTGIPGASDVFRGGVVAYDDAIKVRELDVPADLLERYGAVSAEVAEAMAQGARERLAADVAVAVTGVAGPGGGTPDKPVGLVFLHAAAPQHFLDLRFDFPGERDWIRARATVAALHLVRRLLTQDRHEAG